MMGDKRVAGQVGQPGEGPISEALFLCQNFIWYFIRKFTVFNIIFGYMKRFQIFILLSALCFVLSVDTALAISGKSETVSIVAKVDYSIDAEITMNRLEVFKVATVETLPVVVAGLGVQGNDIVTMYRGPPGINMHE
jgi:hypothetical protein